MAGQPDQIDLWQIIMSSKHWYTALGALLFLLGFGVLLYSYGPIAYQEINYQVNSASPDEQSVEPVDTSFGIVIPKIGANAPIVANVDPYDSAIYQRQLAKGVAHAKDTGLPTDDKTMFLFAHSSGDILMAQRYNSVFYLLNKMLKDDQITVYYDGEPHQYTVTDVKTVAPAAVDYLANVPDADLILMTCTPPGTTWKRLLVLAQKVD